MQDFVPFEFNYLFWLFYGQVYNYLLDEFLLIIK